MSATRKARTVKPYHRAFDGWWYACSARFVSVYGSERVKLHKGPNDLDNQQLATVELRKMLERVEAESLQDDMLVGVLIEEYLNHLEGRINTGEKGSVTEKHFEQVKRVLNDFVEHCGDLTCRAFYDGCHRRIERWLASNLSGGKKRLKGRYNWASSESRRRAVVSVKAAFTFGRKFLNLSPRNIDGVESPSSTARITFFNDEQETAILAVTKDANFADFFTILMETGARTFAEAARFSCENLERDKKGNPVCFDLGEVKKKRRLVYLSPKAQAIVNRLAELYPTGPLFRDKFGKAWNNPSGSRAINRVVGLVMKSNPELGLTEDHTLYSTRHSFIIRQMQETGGDAALVAELAGNSIAVIEAHYWKWGTQRNRLLSALGHKVERAESKAALRVVG